MRYCEIVPDPANNSHSIVVDGVIVSRHTDVKIAELVRAELMREFARLRELATNSKLVGSPLQLESLHAKLTAL